MGLTTTKKMFKKAYDGGYAIGAFNVNNMEIVQGIVEAAIEEKSDVILQVSSGARKYASQEYLISLVEAALKTVEKNKSDINVVLHLDHGDSFELCKDCVDSGFTSVMIDGSKLSFEENVTLTKKVVEYAHSKGVVVEAELGRLAGVEDEVNVSSDDAMYTDPMEAVKFVQLTGCDSLAIAIGTSHGAYKYKGEAKLRLDILKQITDLMPNYPLVLHGASSIPQEFVEKCNKYGGKLPNAKGVTEELLRQAAKLGVCKINVDSDLRLAMTASIRECFENEPDVLDPRVYLGKGREAIKQMVKHKISCVMGSSNKGGE